MPPLDRVSRSATELTMAIGDLGRADRGFVHRGALTRPITPLTGGMQTRLQRRRPRAMRRHAIRLTVRLTTILVGDTATLLLIHAIGLVIASRVTLQAFGAEPLVAMAAPSTRFFV